MKNKLLLLLLFFVFASPTCFSQKAVYVSKKVKIYIKNHKKIAIIPFFGQLIDKFNNLSTAKKEALGIEKGFAVQKSLELYFRERKEKKDLRIDIQKTEITNSILKKNKITLKKLKTLTSQKLCEVLEVDAIIGGSLTLNPKVFNADELSWFSIMIGESDYGRVSIKLSDGKTGKLLWKYEKEITRKSGKNTGEIMYHMMKQASRKIPYEKNKKTKVK